MICLFFLVRRARVDGLEGGMREVVAALTGLGEKVERLAELTVAVQRTSTSTAAAVEVRHFFFCISLSFMSGIINRIKNTPRLWNR